MVTCGLPGSWLFRFRRCCHRHHSCLTSLYRTRHVHLGRTTLPPALSFPCSLSPPLYHWLIPLRFRCLPPSLLASFLDPPACVHYYLSCTSVVRSVRVFCSVCVCVCARALSIKRQFTKQSFVAKDVQVVASRHALVPLSYTRVFCTTGVINQRGYCQRADSPVSTGHGIWGWMFCVIKAVGQCGQAATF